MSKRARLSSFFSHLDFFHQFPVTRLPTAGIGLAVGLSAALSLAQQRRMPQDEDSAENVRLRQEWFYQQRAYPHKHTLRGPRSKAFEQPYKGEQHAGRPTMKSGGITLQNVNRTISYGHLPISFEANEGQSGPQVKFLARVPGYSLFLTSNGAVLSLLGSKESKVRHQKVFARPAPRAPHPESTSNRRLRTAGKVHIAKSSSFGSCLLHVKLEGASPNATLAGLDKLPGKTNYYIGDNPKRWHTNIPTYGKVKYRDVYPGINLVYYGTQRRLEDDFVVAPGADPNQIKFAFKTTGRAAHTRHEAERTVAPRIDSNGDLVIETRAGEVRFEAPHVFQPTVAPAGAATSGPTSPTGRKHIKVRYVLGPGDEVGFEISSYDHSRPLVIDPVLTYATYVDEGGTGSQGTTGHGIGIDASGNAYILGATVPSTGTQTVVVLALNPQGNSFLYTTYLGGQSNTVPGGIAVDSAGNAYIDGMTGASFATTAGAYQSTCSGACSSPFAAKLSPSGSLVYATYLGPSNAAAHAIAIDSSGDAYITGQIASPDLPVVNAFQPQFPGTNCGGCSSAFVQKLDPTGSQLLYSTYFGPLGPNGLQQAANGTGIAVDSSGSAYVVGNGPVPLKNPLEQGVDSMFLAKFTPDGSGLVYSTQLGGSGSAITGSTLVDNATAVAVDSGGDVYVTGEAVSPDFPTTMNAFKASCLELAGGCTPPEAFLIKVNPTGTSLVYSTLLGSGRLPDVTVGSSGNVWVTGADASNYFPLMDPIELSFEQDSFSASNTDAFLMRLNSSGTPTFSTLLGGNFSGESGAGVAVDSNGNAYVAGSTGTSDFPIVNPVPSTVGEGTAGGLFVAKINPSAAGPAISLSPRNDELIELRDVSTSPLTINSITASSNFTLIKGTCGSTLPAGGACVFIVYPESQTASTSGTVTVSSSASASPQTFAVSQKVPGPDSILVSPDLYFQSQLVGTLSATQTVTLTNLDYPTTLGITSIQIPTPSPMGGIYGVFTQTNDCPATLPAGLSCNINVQYQPVAGTDGRVVSNMNIDTSAGQFMVNLTAFRSSSSLAASAQSVQFGTQYAGATPLPRVITLTNTGVQPVTAGGFSVTGPFTEKNNCSAPLAPHTSCRVSISFVPTSNTNATGQLTVNSGGTGSPVAVNLAGTGEIQSDLSISPFQLSFGNVGVGETGTLPLTLTNVSTGTVTISAFNLTSDYTQTNNCNGSLAPQGTCTVTVAFTPTAAGEQDGSLSIVFSGEGSPQVIPLSGNGATALWVTPTSLAFGQQPVGMTSAAQSVTLSDQGTSTVTINSVNVSSGFQLVSNSCSGSIQRFYNCQLQIAFAPTAAGAVTGTLTIDASDSSTPHTVSLSGTGADIPQVSLSPASLTFSSLEAGTTSPPQTITLKNTGDATLTITSLTASGDFAQTNTCGSSVAAGASCAISVTFTPTAGGTLTGTISITDNAPGSPQTVSLSGTATAPTVVLSPSTMTFPSRALNTTSSPQEEAVTNTSITTSLKVSGVSISGDFAETNNCVGSTLGTNATCFINVTFTPTAEGTRTGTLTISDDAPGSPQTVALSGTGASDFVLGVAVGTPASATVSAGSPATFSISVAPVGGFNQTIALACSGAPSLATCTVSPSSVTLDGTDAQNAKVTVTTTAPGLLPPGPNSGPPASGGFAFHDWWFVLLMLMAGLALAFNRRRRIALLAGAVLLTAIAMGCGGGGGGGGGGGNSSPGTSAGTYTLTVTGTSGSLTHTATMTLTVQ